MVKEHDLEMNGELERGLVAKVGCLRRAMVAIFSHKSALRVVAMNAGYYVRFSGIAASSCLACFKFGKSGREAKGTTDSCKPPVLAVQRVKVGHAAVPIRSQPSHTPVCASLRAQTSQLGN